jgi:hypothetical protein
VTAFAVKDSGARAQFDSGMVRDVATDKIDYALAFDGPMFERWAVHMTKGATKYEKSNWMKANGPAELARFRESAVRHFVQWLRGDVDEDHAAACYFNINGYEYVKGRGLLLLNGRVFCPTCRVVAQVVGHPDAAMTCPKCNTPVVRANGDEQP